MAGAETGWHVGSEHAGFQDQDEDFGVSKCEEKPLEFLSQEVM